MARDIIESPVKEKTTVVASKLLMDTISTHVRKNGDNLTSFFTRALVNQLEREGNFTIRAELEEEAND